MGVVLPCTVLMLTVGMDGVGEAVVASESSTTRQVVPANQGCKTMIQDGFRDLSKLVRLSFTDPLGAKLS